MYKERWTGVCASSVSWIFTCFLFLEFSLNKLFHSYYHTHFLLFVCTSLYRHMYQLEQVRLWYSNKQLENTSGSKQQGIRFILHTYCPSFVSQRNFAYWITQVLWLMCQASSWAWSVNTFGETVLKPENALRPTTARTHGLSVCRTSRSFWSTVPLQAQKVQSQGINDWLSIWNHCFHQVKS